MVEGSVGASTPEEDSPRNDDGNDSDQGARSGRRGKRPRRNTPARTPNSPDPAADIIRLEQENRTIADRVRTLVDQVQTVSEENSLIKNDRDRIAVELDSLRIARDRDRGTLTRLGEYHPVIHRDDIELTYIIGGDHGEDRVIETRVTSPDTPLPFMVLRPTIPERSAIAFQDIDFEVAREFGQNTQLKWVILEDAPAPLKCMICFSPSLTSRLRWSIRYRSPGLWNRLRDEREDTLKWTVTSRRGDRGMRCNVTNFAVNFLFPPGVDNPNVIDEEELGHLAGPRMLSSGETLFRWDCPSPEPTDYAWRTRL